MNRNISQHVKLKITIEISEWQNFLILVWYVTPVYLKLEIMT